MDLFCTKYLRLMWLEFPQLISGLLKLTYLFSYCLLFLTSTLFYNASYAATNKPPPVEHSDLSPAQLLKQAETFRFIDQQKGIKLANKALQQADINGEALLCANAHNLLGDLNRRISDTNQSKYHFLQAADIYQSIDAEEQHILASVDYLHTLSTEGLHYQVEDKINDTISLAKEYGHPYPIAMALIVKGRSQYKLKQYDASIEQYSEALNYLTESDYKVQKERAETFTKIAESYKRLKDRTLIGTAYKSALDIYTKIQDHKSMARTLNALSEVERNLKNYKVALDYSLKSIDIQRSINDQIGLAKALSGAGIIYRFIGLYEKSLSFMYQSHLIYKQLNHTKGLAKTSNQMGLIYTRLHEYEQAKSFYNLTINLPEHQVETKTLASALRELAVIDIESEDYEDAKQKILRAHKIYQGQDDHLYESITARIIANIYHAQNDDEAAIIFYKRSLSLAMEAKDTLYQLKAQIPLAEVLIDRDIQQAIELLKSSLVLATTINSTTHMLHVYQELKKAEKAQHNYKAALSYAEKELALSKVIEKQKNDESLTLVKAKLYSHKKERELALLKEKTQRDALELAKKTSEVALSEQAQKIAELELSKNKYANTTLTALLIICLLTVLFIYRRFNYSRQLNKKLDQLATRDPLTNCYNRRALFNLMNEVFEGLTPNDEYCIVLVDIDHFKKVNDIHGHNIGDKVLCDIAEVLKNGIRKDDITVRYGGEEFCLTLAGTQPEQAMKIVEKIREKIELTAFNDIYVTCSFGVASVQFNATTPSELIHQADVALYKSKSLGRNKVTLWSSKMATQSSPD
ncbi:diguanylate cyclase [Psychromonas sp. 14N.309.X.WAT.B.A12]|uniref:tetratricopeptide repeat-containing diguanylate cyclase n=1 Tax=Psychromonas sp. 14N.309.X.WAT.B.A12 TaxID=2998322 RepID=UPI0025AF33A4|nr:tetratricopeptide repeat-containing diguanylate cyclase [Psychromonas sp. 14N.309.X.WAT.B.A12]MDN2665043.1 diguanylate cyclase [Psychromonas sp. 14N.309.X.WAT.B.A12]